MSDNAAIYFEPEGYSIGILDPKSGGLALRRPRDASIGSISDL
jgi:hypothetical protein